MVKLKKNVYLLVWSEVISKLTPPPPIPNNLAYCGTYWLRNSIFNKIIFFKCLYVSFDALLIHSYSKNDFLP